MRISDWSSDVCSSDLIGPVDQHDPGRGLRDGGREVLFAGCSRHRPRAETLVQRGLDRRQRFGTDDEDRRLIGAQPRLLERDQIVARQLGRSEEHTSELQSLMRISYAVFCLKKKNQTKNNTKPNKHTVKNNTTTKHRN